MAYLYTSDQMVLTVGIIKELIRGDVFQWGKIMAGCVLAAAPPVIVYAFLMDYYIAGLTAGATRASGLRREQSAARNRFAPYSEREHGCCGSCWAVKRTPRSHGTPALARTPFLPGATREGALSAHSCRPVSPAIPSRHLLLGRRLLPEDRLGEKRPLCRFLVVRKKKGAAFNEVGAAPRCLGIRPCLE